MQETMFEPEIAKPEPAPLQPREQAIELARRAWRPAGTVVAVLLAALVMWHVVNGNHGLSVWRPVARDEAEVMGEGLPFLRNKARQYGLI